MFVPFKTKEGEQCCAERAQASSAHFTEAYGHPRNPIEVGGAV